MKPSVIILTGLSGSGKTVALRALEDSGYDCVDNLPPQLIGAYVNELIDKAQSRRIAVGIDIREKRFLHVLGDAIDRLKKEYQVYIIFLEAERDVVLRRFKETRRPHPLMREGMELTEAIAEEKGHLNALRERADKIIDTTPFTPHQLRRYVMSLYGRGDEGQEISVTLMSFGFKHGVPQNADMVFDARFLPNPHFIPELSGLNGLDQPVREFVLEKEDSVHFVEKVHEMLEYLVPLFKREGKAYLTVGIGCTGGQHRSVAIVERLAKLMDRKNVGVNVIHREL